MNGAILVLIKMWKTWRYYCEWRKPRSVFEGEGISLNFYYTNRYVCDFSDGWLYFGHSSKIIGTWAILVLIIDSASRAEVIGLCLHWLCQKVLSNEGNYGIGDEWGGGTIITWLNGHQNIVKLSLTAIGKNSCVAIWNLPKSHACKLKELNGRQGHQHIWDQFNKWWGGQLFGRFIDQKQHIGNNASWWKRVDYIHGLAYLLNVSAESRLQIEKTWPQRLPPSIYLLFVGQ